LVCIVLCNDKILVEENCDTMRIFECSACEHKLIMQNMVNGITQRLGGFPCGPRIGMTNNGPRFYLDHTASNV